MAHSLNDGDGLQLPRHRLLMAFPLLVVCLVQFADAACQCSNSTSALRILYAATGGGVTWTSVAWNFSDPEFPCNGAQGSVKCEVGIVTVIDLRNCSLVGTLPATLAAQIPKLAALFLSGNHLTGTMPPEWGLWSSLQQFDVSSNSLTGTLPPQYDNWTRIGQMRANNNQLTGSLPVEYKSWPQVEVFKVDANRMNGTLPPEYAAWKGMKIFECSENEITGTIPKDFSVWSAVTYFKVFSNFLTGTLPPELSRWGATLESFYVDTNSLNGTLPHEYSAWTSITWFSVNVNNITGTLPPQYSTFTGVQEFRIGPNAIYGTLPAQYQSWRNVRVFLLYDCLITGTLPPGYGDWSLVRSFVLGNNQLTGSIPMSYGDGLVKTSIFDVSRNYLSGTIPPKLALLASMTSLILSFNNFSGTIPPSSIATQLVFDVQNNSLLVGTVPPQILVFGIVTLCGTSVTCPTTTYPKLCCLKPGFFADSQEGISDLPAFLASADPYVTPCTNQVATTTPPAPTAPSGARTNHTTRVAQPLVSRTSAAVVYTSIVTGGGALSRGAVPGLQRASAGLRLSSLCSIAQSNGSSSSEDVMFNGLEDNPLSLQVPVDADTLTYAAGASVGNAVLVIVIGVALHAAASFRHRWLQRNTMMDVSSSGAGGFAPTVATLLLTLLPSSALPGSLSAVYGTLLQPATGSSVALVVSTDRTAASVACGVVMLCLWVALSLYYAREVLWLGRWATHDKNFLLGSIEAAARGQRDGGGKGRTKGKTSVVAVCQWLRHYWMEPQRRWVILPSRGRGGGGRRGEWEKKEVAHAAFLEESLEAIYGAYTLNREWFFCVEYGITIISGVILGAAESIASDNSQTSDVVCAAAVWGTGCSFAFGVVQLFAWCLLRPFSVRLEFMSAVVVGGLSVVSLSLTLADADDAAAAVLSASSIIELVMLVLLMADVIIVMRRKSIVLRGPPPQFVENNTQLTLPQLPTPLRRRPTPPSQLDEGGGGVVVCDEESSSLTTTTHHTRTHQTLELERLLKLICVNEGSKRHGEVRR